MSQKKEKVSKKKHQFKKKVSKVGLIDDAIQSLQEQYENVDSKQVKKFTDFPLSQETLRALDEANYQVPTEIQKETLMLSLKGEFRFTFCLTNYYQNLVFQEQIF